MSKANMADPKRSAIDRVLDGIERVANKLPPPGILFCYLFIIVAVLGAIFSFLQPRSLFPPRTFSQRKASSGCSATSSKTLPDSHRSAWSSP